MNAPRRCVVFQSAYSAASERVFGLDARPDAFLLTPWWSGARVVRAARTLRPGEQASLRPGFGLFAIDWEAVHEVYEPPACFVESQRCGPLRFWRHRHPVLPQPPGSVLRDEVEYALPLPSGMLEAGLNVLFRLFLRALFAYRHRLTRAYVEGNGDHPHDVTWWAGVTRAHQRHGTPLWSPSMDKGCT